MENHTLPVISLAQLSTADPKALQELSSACSDIGFFYLKDHGIPQETLSRILDLASSFFLNASPEEKQSLARGSPDEARGYQKIGENITKGLKDAHEAVDLYRPWDSSLPKYNDEILTGDNLWPATPTSLRSEVAAYIQEVLVIGVKLVQAMAMSLQIQPNSEEWNELVGQVNESFWVARLIGYPPMETAVADGISCGEHTGTLSTLPKSTF
jgi:isopenicillin N synthase-like dioxygenase